MSSKASEKNLPDTECRHFKSIPDIRTMRHLCQVKVAVVFITGVTAACLLLRLKDITRLLGAASYTYTLNPLNYSTLIRGSLQPVDSNPRRTHTTLPRVRSDVEENIVAPTAATNSGTVRLHPDVNIVPSTLPESYVLPYEDCVPLPSAPKEGVVICVHPVKEDKFVSRFLKIGILWEYENMLEMETFLRENPDVVFVDLGSNIGQYALFAAAMGRRVVAVEMLTENVRHIQRALTLSGLGTQVTIVNNALFSDHRVLATKFLTENLGGARLNLTTADEVVSTTHVAVSVQTICLDDLTPLLESARAYVKMDIENSEHHALRCARNFFERVSVAVVQMEWMNRQQDESEEILKFMSDHGYVMSSSSVNHLAVSFQKVVRDVFFIKLPPAQSM